ncbi:MAG: glycosyltransferase [Bacteroidota bacterium]
MSAQICHISVLNPALHPRIFYKLAKSQRKLGYTVSILAQDQLKTSYENEGIRIHPIRPFHRLSFRRLFFSFLNYRRAKQIKADVYVLHSPELLLMGLILRWRLGSKLIYDVHEDYARTFRAVSHYPGLIGRALSGMVRALEKWAIKYIDAVSYAEDCYDNVLGVENDRKFFLRNKFQHQRLETAQEFIPPFTHYMLYSGTLAEDWGIFKSLDIWEKWNAYEPLNFVMAGVSPRKEIIQQIQTRVDKSPYKDRFLLIGGDTYVPYANIMSLVRHCSFGTALYYIKPYIQGKMPTKFYEYMAYDKPLIYSKEESWDRFNEKEQLGFAWEKHTDVLSLMESLKVWEGNPPEHKLNSYSWIGEEEELERMMKELFKN